MSAIAKQVETDPCLLAPLCPHCGSEIITHNVPHTARQAEILRYLIGFQQRRGYRPSYAQIAKQIGVKSRSTIAKHIRSLERQGLLQADELETKVG